MLIEDKIIAVLQYKDYGLSDYKVHCFNGIPKVILVCRDRYSISGLTEDFFDIEWKHLNVQRPNHPNSLDRIKKPENLQQMLQLARKISANIPFARIDYYEVAGRLYFGETTFFPASGFVGFLPEEFDMTMGSWIQL